MKQIVIFSLIKQDKEISTEDIKSFEKQLKEIKTGKREAIIVPFRVETQTQLLLDENEIEDFYREGKMNDYTFEEDENLNTDEFEDEDENEEENG